MKIGVRNPFTLSTHILPDIDPTTRRPFGLTHLGWHGPRQPPSQENPSPDDNHPECGDPIDLSSGILVIRETDLEITGGRGRIGLDRTYRSLTTTAGPFGLGTNHTYGYRLSTHTPQGRRVINLIMPNGNVMSFTKHPDGTFSNTTIPAGRGAVLSLTERNEVKLRWKDGTVFYFMPATSALGSVLESITDRNGNQTRLIRSTRSPAQILEVIDPVERKLRLTYDQNDRIVSILDPIGRIVRYTYNSQGTLETVTDPEGGVTRYDYNTQNQLTQITDARGTVVARNTYDANGRVIQQTQADGGVWRFAYKLLNPLVPLSPVQQTTVTDPRGNPTTFRFSPQGFVLSRTDALGQTTEFEVENGTNQWLSTTDSQGRTAQYGYDIFGNLISNKNPDGSETTFEYEATFNTRKTITDELGNVTNITHDSNGNVLTTSNQLNEITSFAYNAFGQQISVTDPLGIVDPQGHTITNGYDGQGNLTFITDPLGNISQRTYDDISRLVEIKGPRGFVTNFEYDNLNRVTKITDARKGTTQFEYDPIGNITKIIDAHGEETTYKYNAMGQLIERTDPSLLKETYEFDSHLNLITFTDRKNQITTYVYDSVDRRTNATYHDGNTTNFTYNAGNRLVQIADSLSGIIGFSYDIVDRVLKETSPQGSVSYTYDAKSLRRTMTVNGQAVVNYDYDAVSRLKQVSQGAQEIDISYDVVGRRTSLTYPNGTTTTYAYDNASQLNNLVHQGPSGVLEDLTYTYDAGGNQNSITRVSEVATTLPPEVEAAYNAANQQIQFNSATPNLIYDVNGNLESQSDGNGTTTYTWDVRDRLIAMNGPGVSANFVYDARGRRISKTINGKTISYLYDGNNVVAEIQEGDLVVQYLNSLNIDEKFIRQGENTEYYHMDGNGSTLALTDDSGTIRTHYQYDPFGSTTTTGSSENSFQFTGRENDGTGLYYYRARYYSPKFHRFLGEDKILVPFTPLNLGPCLTNETGWSLRSRVNSLQAVFGQRFNAYPYVLNNPFLFTDPFGLADKEKRNKCTRDAARDCAIDTSRETGGNKPASCILKSMKKVTATYGDKGGTGPEELIDAGDLAKVYEKCFDDYKGNVPDSCNAGQTMGQCP